MEQQMYNDLTRLTFGINIAAQGILPKEVHLLQEAGGSSYLLSKHYKGMGFIQWSSTQIRPDATAWSSLGLSGNICWVIAYPCAAPWEHEVVWANLIIVQYVFNLVTDCCVQGWWHYSVSVLLSETRAFSLANSTLTSHLQRTTADWLCYPNVVTGSEIHHLFCFFREQCVCTLVTNCIVSCLQMRSMMKSNRKE